MKNAFILSWCHLSEEQVDTQKALKAFKEKYQITEQNGNPSACGGYFPVWRQPFWSQSLFIPRFRENGSMEGGNEAPAPRGLYASDSLLHNPVPAFFRPFPRKRLPEIQPQSSHGRKSRVFVKHDNAPPVYGRRETVLSQVLGTVFTVDESCRHSYRASRIGKGAVLSTGQPDVVILTEAWQRK